jgi:hypothetical protein
LRADHVYAKSIRLLFQQQQQKNCGQTDRETDGRSGWLAGWQADIIEKLIIAFRNFAKQPQVRGVPTIVTAIP